MSTALKERLTERLRTSRHWLPVEDLEAACARPPRRDRRDQAPIEPLLVVTIDKKQLPYKPGEKALLAF
jgi:hypothetical protein